MVDEVKLGRAIIPAITDATHPVTKAKGEIDTIPAAVKTETTIAVVALAAVEEVADAVVTSASFGGRTRPAITGTNAYTGTINPMNATETVNAERTAKPIEGESGETVTISPRKRYVDKMSLLVSHDHENVEKMKLDRLGSHAVPRF